ncbi:HD-GYP domain-containing protein [Anaerosolibacter carboniphilus]|nr:HD-GYP domain-containing protein [Anaerosolibacter carboniphilus]
MKYFTLYSLIAFSVTGIILTYFITEHMKTDKISSNATLASIILNAEVSPLLSEEVLITGLPSQNILAIEKNIMKVPHNINMLMLNIINKEGTIIFSTDNALINTKVFLSQNIKSSFSGKVHYQIIDSNQIDYLQKFQNKKIIEAYLPIILGTKTYGTYEIYMNFADIGSHINDLKKLIYATVFFGLSILFISLLKIIRNASNTLIQQNNALRLRTEELQSSYAKLNTAYKNTVLTLSNAIEARDPYTRGHSERVTTISLILGSTLGLSDEQLKTLETASLFHDIGKLGISDLILHKPEKLTEEEFKVIKNHPIIGVNILGNIDFLKNILPIILHHHEKFDGSGYPLGIRGESIPLKSRIIAVADTYDAMTSNRPYRKGLPHEQAVEELIRLADIQFDRQVVDAFLISEHSIKESTIEVN